MALAGRKIELNARDGAYVSIRLDKASNDKINDIVSRREGHSKKNEVLLRLILSLDALPEIPEKYYR